MERKQAIIEIAKILCPNWDRSTLETQNIFKESARKIIDTGKFHHYHNKLQYMQPNQRNKNTIREKEKIESILTDIEK